MNLYDNLVAFFSRYDIAYREFEHEATDTCDSSAAMRKNLGIEGVGSKNICFHARGHYYMVTTLASWEFKARLFKKAFGTKDIRFADEQELSLNAGAPFGCVPPLGFCNESIPLFVDSRVFELPYFLFNPATHTKTWQVSGEMMKKAYFSTKNPVYIFTFHEETGMITFCDREGVVHFTRED